MSCSTQAIYLDHAATTPLHSEVFSAMKPYLTDNFYNPNSIYQGALEARGAIDESRGIIAKHLSARPNEIIFTDGGTEANNLAILGTVRSWQRKHPEYKPHIITTKIEHSSVLETCKYLETECDVDYLSVNENGEIDLGELKELINERTVLVTIGYANGEIGTIADIRAIAKTIRYYRKHHESFYPYLHTDAVQAVNYLNINVLQLGVDLMTIAGSKIYGPKKIGALFVKTGTDINPIMFGGKQERGLLPGTENVPYIIGFAKAIELARKDTETELTRLGELKKIFMSEVQKIPGAIINSGEEGLPNIINVTFSSISSEELVIRLDAKGILCSVKSACKAGEDGDSHVILALRELPKEDKETGSVRFSMGRGTRKEDVAFTLKTLSSIVTNMKKVAELYN